MSSLSFCEIGISFSWQKEISAQLSSIIVFFTLLLKYDSSDDCLFIGFLAVGSFSTLSLSISILACSPSSPGSSSYTTFYFTTIALTLGCTYWSRPTSPLPKQALYASSKMIPSRACSNQILSHSVSFYFPSDRFLNGLESRRIWVEGGDPSGVDNFSLPP